MSNINIYKNGEDDLFRIEKNSNIEFCECAVPFQSGNLETSEWSPQHHFAYPL